MINKNAFIYDYFSIFIYVHISILVTINMYLLYTCSISMTIHTVIIVQFFQCMQAFTDHYNNVFISEFLPFTLQFPIKLTKEVESCKHLY